jgi:thiol-disulfide isomerase/thioredoxin
MSKEIHQDFMKLMLKEVQQPQILSLLTYGDKEYYSTRIFVSPGDSIMLQFQNGRLQFSGENLAHYKFFYALDSTDAEWAKLKFKSYTGDLERYMKQCDSLYQKRMNFFYSYIKEHPLVSVEFKEAVQNELKFELLRNLISPRFESQAGYYINTTRDLSDLLANSNREEGKLFDINEYLDHLKIEELNKPELIQNDYFKMSLVPLLRQYFVRSDANPYSKKAFEEEIEFIRKNLNKEVANLAIGKLIVEYHEKGLGKDQRSRTYFLNFISEFKNDIQDSSYINAMNDIEYSLSSIQHTISPKLDESLINTNRDTIRIQKLLTKKNIKVIDFWASWCEPCLQDFDISEKIREQLKTQYNIDFIYISLDSDPKKWINATQRYSQILQDDNYRLLNPKKSSLIKALKIQSSYGISIPRYIILDKENVVLDNNAPKPSSRAFEEIIKSIK